MQRYLIFAYSVIGYLSALISLTYLIFWLYPWEFMPSSIDSGESSSYAIMIDVGLILLFALQHSIMPRSFFKKRVFANSLALQAGTYSLLSSLCLLLLYLFWQPIQTTIWDFKEGFFFWSLSEIYISGWIFAFISTFLIDHFELFGLHQGYRLLRGLPEPKITFQSKWFYKIIRHPIQAGTLVGIWATPTMSYGHLLFAFCMTVYVLIGLRLEERDLSTVLGEEYQIYKKEVPMLLPLSKKNRL